DVVAEHHRAGQFVDAEVGGFLADAPRRRQRVGGAHIGDDADAAAQAFRQHRAHALDEAGIVAELGVVQLGQRLARYRALGQALEDEIVDIALLDELERRLPAVAGIAGAGPDSDVFAARLPTAPT